MNIWGKCRKLENLNLYWRFESIKERIKLNIGIKKYSVWNWEFVRLFPWIRRSKPGFMNRKTGQCKIMIPMQKRKVENTDQMWRAVWNWINSEQEFSKPRKVIKSTASRSFMNSKQEDLYQTILRHVIIKLVKDYKNLKRQKGNSGVKNYFKRSNNNTDGSLFNRNDGSQMIADDTLKWVQKLRTNHEFRSWWKYSSNGRAKWKLSHRNKSWEFFTITNAS